MSTDERERDRIMDAFAKAPDSRGELTPAQIFGQAPAERIFGAQQVAVKRDEEVILVKLKKLAAAAGEDWYYRWPVTDSKGKTSWVEGPSIKLANNLARIYGNADVDTRVIDIGDSWIFYARFLDIETGFSMTRAYQQRKGQKSIKTDPERARDIAFQIGQSKAIRNVVVNALETFADFAFDEARKSLVDKIGKNLSGYRQKLLDGFTSIDFDLKRVERSIGRVSADWLAPDCAILIATMKAVRDGMATLDESFPPLKETMAAEAEKEAEKTEEVSGLDAFADVAKQQGMKINPDFGSTESAKRGEVDTKAKREADARAAAVAAEQAKATAATEAKTEQKEPAADPSSPAAPAAEGTASPSDHRAEGDAGSGGEPAPGSGEAKADEAEPEPDEKEQLLGDLRSAAIQGTKELNRHKGRLTQREFDLLSKQDWAPLDRAAKLADKEGTKS